MKSYDATDVCITVDGVDLPFEWKTTPNWSHRGMPLIPLATLWAAWRDLDGTRPKAGNGRVHPGYRRDHTPGCRKGWCGPTAVAAIAGVSYAQAEAAIKAVRAACLLEDIRLEWANAEEIQAGPRPYKPRHSVEIVGAHRWEVLAAIRNLGVTMWPRSRGNRLTLRALTAHYQPDETWLISTTHHFVVWHQGCQIDNCHGVSGLAQYFAKGIVHSVHKVL